MYFTNYIQTLTNNQLKYLKHYNSLIFRSINRNINVYTEKHHIVPKCMGGTNSKNNLVKLTPEEHYVAHQLLVKIFPNNYKLVYAANMMCKNRTNNKMYGWLKRKFRVINSGSSSPMYGKKHSLETKLKIIHSGNLRRSLLSAEDSKILYGNPGQLNGMFSKNHTEESKQNISITRIQRITEGLIVPTKHSDDHKKYMSIIQTGSSNSFYGKGRYVWIHNNIISKRILKEQIPLYINNDTTTWLLGRVPRI